MLGLIFWQLIYILERKTSEYKINKCVLAYVVCILTRNYLLVFEFLSFLPLPEK